jgi:hydroxymethylglutaryl-CoA lyase
MKWSNLPKKVRIIEVGPRDGLQNERTILKTKDKAQFVRLLCLAGLPTIEASSFVRPDRIPQMADAEELFKELEGIDKGKLVSLVPNIKGLEKAIACGLQEVAVFTSVSDTFNKKNINASVDESFERLTPVVKEAQKNGLKVRGYISTVFGCPYEGKTSLDTLKSVSTRLLDLGIYELSLGDTIGCGTPKQTSILVEELQKVCSLDKVAMHFHDTRGMALTNILVALEYGITTFDSSAGGLGGCPYALGAAGNVATEDLLYLFESLDIETGVDMEKVIEASSFIFGKLGKLTTSKFLQSYLSSGHKTGCSF